MTWRVRYHGGPHDGMRATFTGEPPVEQRLQIHGLSYHKNRRRRGHYQAVAVYMREAWRDGYRYTFRGTDPPAAMAYLDAITRHRRPGGGR